MCAVFLCFNLKFSSSAFAAGDYTKTFVDAISFGVCVRFLIIIIFDLVQHTYGKCVMPQILRGSWFSWELGKPTLTVIDDVSMSQRGDCETFIRDGADYTFVFKSPAQNCYHCVKTFPRTLNVFEKYESPCISLDANDEPTVERICSGINEEQQLITLFNENYIPINCRSSLEGVWQFAFQVSLMRVFLSVLEQHVQSI